MAKVRSTNKITYDNSKFASKMAKAPLYGVYQAEVVDTKDTSRTGRMRVFCASLAKDTAIAAGDIVDVNIPYTASTKTPRNELYDNIYKGKFLVSKVRHDFYPLDKSHVMNVQVVKDSLPESLPSGFNPEIVEDNPNFNEEVF